ncbi:hypothetical protein [Paenibacillus lactis]|uniref:hypothetical protein n=1 Tax=Paenibacillus lactis TaxID=228574 RepID=UPI003696A77B
MAVNVRKLQKITTPFENTNSDTAAIQKLAQQRVNKPAIQGTVTSVTRPSVNSVSGGTSPTAAASQSRPSYQQEAQTLYDMMKNRATQTPKEFSYDPQSDPAYQAALQRARSNIDAGNSQAQAEMNRRGILNSTITSDRMGEIAANEMGRVETDVLPSLMQQAYQRYADGLAREQQQFQNLGSLYGMNINEDQRGFDNRVTEAGLTGNYMPPGAQDAINNILDLKRQAEQKGLTAAERANLSARADGYRAQLASMGIDPSFYGANVNSRQASQANPALRTLQGQQMDMSRQAANWGAAQSVWDATGRLVRPQSDWSGLLRQVQNGSAPLTIAAQQQSFANNMALEQFAYQKARDAIADQQWKSVFDQNVREFGLNYALQQLAQQNDQAYRQAQLALSQDDNARQWAMLDYEMSNPPTSGSSGGLTANQVLQSMQSLYTEPVFTTDEFGNQTRAGSQLTKDPAKREQMFLNVVDSGLSDAETNQILNSLGMTKQEIDKYMKKYGAASGN